MSHKIKIKQVDLSGVTQDNTKTRFLVINANGDLSWNDSPQTGSAGISGLNFYDEGVLVGTYAKVNFVGTGVFADENPTASDTINVYIPPPTYASHFNTNDGTTNGLVVESGITRANVRISSPTTEGTPFYTGGGANALWAGGVHSAHLVSNGTPLAFNTNAAVTGFGGDSTITVKVFSGDGTTVLATFTTPVITANGVFSSSGANAGISVEVINYATDSLKYKAQVGVHVDLYSMFRSTGTLGLDGGRYHVKIEHTTDTTTDGGTTYSYTQADAFIDINPSTPSFGAGSSVTIIESPTPSNVVTRHISGVEYYTIGSQFEAGATEINNINANTQGRAAGANTNFQLTAANYGLSTITQSVWSPSFGTFTGWNNNHDNTDDSYLVTDWTIPSSSFRYRGVSGTASATVFDPWAASSPKTSASNLILIDTISGGSSQYIETFNDETFRRQSNYSTSWSSTLPLVNGQACVVGGTLVRPDRYYLTDGTITPNLTSYKPDKGGGNPNYTGFSNDASFYRSFYTTLSASTVPIPSFSMVFSGTFVGTALSDLQNQHLKIFVRKIGATVGNSGTSSPPLLLHGAEYDFGTFNDGSTAGTDTPGIRLGSSSGSTINGTFGGFNATNGIYVEIQICHQTIRIDTITVTFN
jgi:hypothetical protein